jgi:hypothetical protein
VFGTQLAAREALADIPRTTLGLEHTTIGRLGLAARKPKAVMKTRRVIGRLWPAGSPPALSVEGFGVLRDSQPLSDGRRASQSAFETRDAREVAFPWYGNAQSVKVALWNRTSLLKAQERPGGSLTGLPHGV